MNLVNCRADKSFIEVWNLIPPPLELAFWYFFSFAFNSQVISSVGDLVGIKYFPAEPNKLQKDEGMIKED